MSLVDQIRTIERRLGRETVRSGASHEDDDRFLIPLGFTEIDAALGGGLSRAALHEWFGVGNGDEPPEPRKYSVWVPPLLPLVHLARQALVGATGSLNPPSAASGSFQRYAVWIGRRCVPYGGVLLGAEGDRSLLERSLFVIVDRAVDRRWTADLALRCPTVAVVVTDGSGFDMAATRRLQLVAKTYRTPIFLARPPWEVRQLSAAQTRWLVRWDAAAGTVDDESNVLNPRWSIELLRCKGGQPEYRPRVWALEWDRDQGALRVLAPLAGATGDAGTSTSKRRLRQA